MFLLANILTTGLAFLFVVVCVFMILVVLIQKPKGGGLSGAFGGAGGGDSQAVFGARVGDFLTWFTVGCFALFVLLAIALVYATRAETSVDVDAGASQVESVEGEGDLGGGVGDVIPDGDGEDPADSAPEVDGGADAPDETDVQPPAEPDTQSTTP